MSGHGPSLMWGPSADEKPGQGVGPLQVSKFDSNLMPHDFHLWLTSLMASY